MTSYSDVDNKESSISGTEQKEAKIDTKSSSSSSSSPTSSSSSSLLETDHSPPDDLKFDPVGKERFYSTRMQVDSSLKTTHIKPRASYMCHVLYH